ncbi:DUF2909 family protein [Rheinheimera salexigens]|uniref:DUF2909 domain-containing protein n=1 Tax=Rheinheimera salexigens TaxID=1628148 RepID=A0A1E7Q2A3_9GAMM|nr:DUF2909 family protein [Rheinheimera salexigens]OEY68220.1 hypothetical protein BI198_00545 [Rheinheimera salexigens]
MLIKLVIIALLLFIIFNLFRAGIIMLRTTNSEVSMSRYLGRRLVISIVLLLLIFLAIAFGLIQPNPTPF